MKLVRICFTIFLNCLIVCSALQCTTNCTYTVDMSKEFFINEQCTQKVSAGRCEFGITVWHDRGEYIVSFQADSSSYILDDRYHAMVQLPDTGSAGVSYSLDHECKKKDDCAKEYAINMAPKILEKPRINSADLRRALMPLLAADRTVSAEKPDLICFDAKDNARQCSIATVPGVCEVSYDIEDKESKRSCDNELIGSTRYVSAYQSSTYASFSVKCDRILCNGDMTLNAAKQIMFKYNITATPDGLLNSGSSVIFYIPLLSLLIFTQLTWL